MAHPASSKVAGLALSAIAWIVQKEGGVMLRGNIALTCCRATVPH